MKLSAREQQIIDLVVQGYLNINIAAKLGLSQNTVCAHLKRIYSKLNISGTLGEKRLKLSDRTRSVIG